MEMFEKVEKLRERANVTFEEAREALDACNGDLLDAMVYLEKKGKAKEPEQSTYSTSYEEQQKFVSVEEKVKSQQKPEGIFDTIRGLVRGFIDKCRGNYFCAKKDNEIKFKIPVLLFIILVLTFWQVAVPAMLILLFFGFQYSFYGKDELNEVNELLNKVSNLAEQVKDGLSRDNNKTDASEETVSEETDAENIVYEAEAKVVENTDTNN